MLALVADAEDAVQEALLNAGAGCQSSRGEAAALVAPRDRDQRQPAGDRAPAQARAADRLRPGGRPTRRTGRALVESVWVEPYPDQMLASRTGLAAWRRATSSARASSSPSSRRSSTCRRASAPSSSSATCSATRRARRPRCSRCRRRVSTARCSAPGQGRRRAASRPQPAGGVRLADDRGLREIVDRYVDAFERNDVDAVAGMLAADGAFTMPPVPGTAARGGGRVPDGHVLASDNRWRLVPLARTGWRSATTADESGGSSSRAASP